MTQASHSEADALLRQNPVLAALASMLPVEDLSIRDESGSADGSEHVDLGQTFDDIARVLFRSKRRHPLLCGNKGVGKTTAIRQFVNYISTQSASRFQGATILYIDALNVGPEDSRACLESLITAVRDFPELLLCVDGIASLMKRSHGGTNKPLLRALLQRSNIGLVGTMVDWEYVESVANDAQMLDVFTRIDLREPEGTQLDRIVSSAAKTLATEFDLGISDETVGRAIALTSMFLLNESQPAKAIDVLRQGCEDVRYEQITQQSTQSQLHPIDLVHVISDRTGIPPETVGGLGQDSDFKQALSDAVVGQKEAVQEVATELQLISAGLTETGKPASVMMFVGMTGVGKTELAKRIAELYSTSKRLQVYSMGNFTEPHSVSSIIGVPPGYVGHEEGGRLINELRADPYCVVLLDEAEKCHPNVWKPFLNLFDEGWIADQRGVKAYAHRAIFVLTTNAGDRSISQLAQSGKSREEIVHHLKQTLSRVRHERSSQPVFPPSFLARIKRIVVFNPLDEEALTAVTKCAIQRLIRRWRKSRQKRVIVAPELVSRIGTLAHQMNQRCHGQEGGRIVQKLLSDHVEHVIHSESLKSPKTYHACDEITVSVIDDAQECVRTRVTFS